MTKYLSVQLLICLFCYGVFSSQFGASRLSVETTEVGQEGGVDFAEFAANYSLESLRLRPKSSFFFDSPIGQAGDSIAVSQDTIRFSNIGQTSILAATVFDASGTFLADVPLVWSIANPAVATVDQSGLVTAMGGGRTRVVITTGTVSVRVMVFVNTDDLTVVAESERAALTKFYEAIDGKNWDQNTNWMGENSLDTWHGVSTNARGYVTALELDDNGLTGHLPAELGSLSQLARLDLSLNRLSGSLPGELGKLSKLQTFDIADNAGLSGEVPASFANLEELRVFEANGTDVCLPVNPLLRSWSDGLETSLVSLCEVSAAPGLVLSESNLSVTEGSSNQYTVRLLSAPTAAVAVTITGHSNADLVLDQASLMFTPTDWDAVQTVTVTAEQDDNATNEVVTLVHTASGGNYEDVNANVVVTVTDDDSAQLDLSVSNLPVTEGSSNQYTVRLSSEPTGTVTVGITGRSGTSLRLDKASLTFTPTDWNVAQTLTVTAGEDDDATNEEVTLVHTASGGNYEDVNANVVVTVTDDDSAQLDLSVSNLPVTEGSSNQYTVRLSSEPTGTVTVGITGHSGTSLRLDKASLTFTPTDWNVAQTVTVTAGQDLNASSEDVMLAHTASGSNYEDMNANVVVTVTDDDLAQLDLSVSNLPVPEGGSNHYTVRLSSEPTGTVTVGITGHSGTILRLDKASLTFTPTDWNVAQTLTVTAGQDDDATNEDVTLVHTASGSNYADVRANVVVTVTDDDSAQLDLSVSNLSVTEGSSNQYTVRLSSAPTGTVTVGITGHVSTDLNLDKPSLTFTLINWQMAQTVTVTAEQDDDATNERITLVHTASGGNYGNASTNVEVDVTDDDPPGVLVVSPASVSVSEGGGSPYTVRLSSEPTGVVTVGITGHADTDLDLDKPSLTFTTSNWRAAQTVTVTARQDDDATDDTGTLLHTASGADYAGMTAKVAVRVEDDDAPGVLEFLPETASVPEGDNSDYTVRLSSAPTGTVTVEVTGHTGTDLTLARSSLMFTTSDWGDSQTVTVTAGEDNDATNDTEMLMHTVSGANYGGVTGNVAVTVEDNDIRGLDISAASLAITEGASKNYTVRLTTQPTANVVVAITGHASTDLTLDKSSLTFTTSNWNVVQTVTVTAEQDEDAANDTETLLHTASGADYHSVTANVGVTVPDDDAPGGLEFSSANVSLSEGGNSDYTVRLSSAPTGTVTVVITGYAGTDLTLDKSSLTFTTLNWGDAQTVTVTAGQDDDATNDSETLVHTASGANYGGVTGDIAVTVEDNDTKGLDISVANLAIDEGASKNYTVRLLSVPTGTVTVTITGHASTDLMLNKASLTFTTSDWSAVQTVTVAASQDDDSANDTATLVHTASGADYAGVTGNVAVTIEDNYAQGLNLSVASLAIDEGASKNYTVRLSGEPTGTVTVTITGHTAADLILDKPSLTFTTSDWNDAQTVTVSAGEDDDATNDTATLVHTASGANYGDVTGNVAVTVEDDDMQGLDISVESLAVGEGASKSYMVRLTTEPSANVVVEITGYADTDLTLNHTSLTFTTSNWSTNQSVTVDAGQDDDQENDTAILVHTASGADYGDVTRSVPVTVSDDDLDPRVVISSEYITLPEGGSTDYTVWLSRKPIGKVTVTISTTPNSVLTTDKNSLIFTTSNWDEPQTVTANAPQDNDKVDEQEWLIHVPQGGGSVAGKQYLLLAIVSDDDKFGIDLSTSSLSVDEGKSASYTIRLASKPSADVTVKTYGHTRSSLGFNKTVFTFTPTNWSNEQTVTVTAAHDIGWTTDNVIVSYAAGSNYDNAQNRLWVSVADDETPPPPPYAYVFQAVHSFFNSVPLIAGEPATLRVFPIANKSSSVTLPRAIVTFYLNGEEHTINIPAGTNFIQTEVWPQGLGFSLNADVPADIIQPGLEMVIEVDPDGEVPEELGIAKRIPATGRISIGVVTVPTFNIVFVPLVTTGHEGGEDIIPTANEMAASPNTHSTLRRVRDLFPIKDISATAHAPVTVDTKGGLSLYSVCPENACAPGLFRDIGVHFGSIRLIIGGAVVFETLVCAGFFCITGISYLLDTPLASARTSHLMFFLG